MSAYVIVYYRKIHDADMLRQYRKLAQPTLVSAKAVPKVVSSTSEVLEGNPDLANTVVIEFSTLQDARSWYNSEEYQAAAKVRKAAATCDVVIVEGL